MTDGETRALAAAEALGLRFEVVRHGPVRSLEEAASARGVTPAQVVKTMVVRVADGDYRFVLVPGGREIDWPKLRAHLGVRRLSLPDQEEAREATGYERGAITPFGATNAWPVIADASVAVLDRVAIGGGARGVNVHLASRDLVGAANAVVADVTKG